MNDDGTEEQRLTSHISKDYQFAWSPDGKRIVYVSERDGNPEIYVVNVESTEEARLTFNEFPDLLPAWSPDGKRIVFVSSASIDGDIYIMDADGENQVRLTDNPAKDSDPSWYTHRLSGLNAKGVMGYRKGKAPC